MDADVELLKCIYDRFNARTCFVYTKNFAAYGRIEDFDGLDDADRAAFLHCAPTCGSSKVVTSLSFS